MALPSDLASEQTRILVTSMHKAACNGRDFDVILVWDQDRFGRFNSLEAGYWIHPLMRAGVRLDTVTDGPVNWDDFTGRVMYGLKQEGKYQFLRDLSRNVTRGQISNAQKGYLCGQAAPYGFDRMLVNESGEPVQRVRNGEQFAKPRSWHVTLVESDDPEKVATLKWLFQTYAETDTGLRSLANDLNSRGVPGPNGGLWHMGTIREILRNEAYMGDFVWAKRRLGKYHRVAAGEIKERPTNERLANGEPQTKKNDEAEWIVRRNVHPALVDRKLFARAQEKLTARKGRTGPKSKCGDGYVLTGLIHCAHCGKKMYGTKLTVKRHGKKYVYHKYICSTYHTKGKDQCGYNNVSQDLIVKFLIGQLRDAVLCGGQRDKLRKHLEALAAAEHDADPKAVAQQRAKLADLEGQIAHGTKRLLKAPDGVADLLGTELAALRRERDRLAADLDAAEHRQAGNTEADIEAALGELWTLADGLDSDDPAILREFVRRMVSRIDLWFDAKQVGPRLERPISKGVIELRPEAAAFKLDSRGDWI